VLAQAQDRDQDVVLETARGTLIGARIVSDGSPLSLFRGIPYAVPPVGERRWKPAELLHASWEGEREATSFAPACMQPQTVKDKAHYAYRPAPQMSEDCLYLNIWTPAKLPEGPPDRRDEVAGEHSEKLSGKRPERLTEKPAEKLPVMVWIHGGSLVDGAASWSIYDGAGLARKGVVFVSISYRLNVFGYFSHPALTAESGHKASGNYGVNDQITALKWVRDNISVFGGDPDNVTIFGESAGAYSVLQLLVSPLSEGLFHRAIAQSPYLKPLPALDRPQYGLPAAEASGETFAAALGAKTLAELRALPAADILNAVNRVDDPYAMIPNPVVDGWVFPAQLFELFEAGAQHDVPVLAGYTGNEGFQMSLRPDWQQARPETAREYEAMVRARYGDLSDSYLALYPPSDRENGLLAPYRDGFFGWAAQKIVRESRRVPSDAYLYYFDQAFGWARNGGYGAFHGIDLPYTFNAVGQNAKYSANWPDLEPTAADYRVADIISDYWVAFASGGAPRAKDRPEWPAYQAGDRAYMAFRDGRAYAARDLLPGSFELHEQIIRKRREAGNMPWSLVNIGLLAPVRSKP
jgi:para-nitrobenzyl esterase